MSDTDTHYEFIIAHGFYGPMRCMIERSILDKLPEEEREDEIDRIMAKMYNNYSMFMERK